MLAPAPVRLRVERTRGADIFQLSRRTNGLPVRIVDRRTAWGNPWRVGEDGVETRRQAVELFEHWLTRLPEVQPGQRLYVLHARLPELRGHNLACTCPLDEPCHADVLLRLVSRVCNSSGGAAENVRHPRSDSRRSVDHAEA